MFRRLRAGMTYANVASTLALFLAVSTGGAYAANTIFSTDIVDGEVKTPDVAANAINASKVANNTLTSFDIAAETLSSGRIFGLDGTDIDDNSLGAGQLAPNSVGSSELAGNSVTSAKVLDDTAVGGGLAAPDLSANSVATSEIATDGVQATEIANDSIDSGEIVDFSLSNQDVGVLFAQVNANGTIANSSGGVTGSRIGLGSYEVDFGRNISTCAFVMTQGEASAGGAPGAITGVTDRSGNVEAVFATVRTNANALADRSFQLVVVC